MKQIEMGGYYAGTNHIGRRYLSVILDPSSKDILMTLNLLENQKYGVLELENTLAEDEVEPQKLTLYFEEGNYLLMLLDYDEEGYIDVRTPYNTDALKDEFQNILGEPYGATTIVQDFELVKKCFIEFNQTGNVSRDLLN
ncbi:hypothetical protein [Acinetobacter sp.]|uniref:DUF6911 family protein n=1 Tax=Acinetobacter sp. TaxID=472 RepID=UPI0025851727|nr:hypothetical protein [Acinetobacter sp.]